MHDFLSKGRKDVMLDNAKEEEVTIMNFIFYNESVGKDKKLSHILKYFVVVEYLLSFPL